MRLTKRMFSFMLVLLLLLQPMVVFATDVRLPGTASKTDVYLADMTTNMAGLVDTSGKLSILAAAQFSSAMVKSSQELYLDSITFAATTSDTTPKMGPKHLNFIKDVKHTLTNTGLFTEPIFTDENDFKKIVEVDIPIIVGKMWTLTSKDTLDDPTRTALRILLEALSSYEAFNARAAADTTSPAGPISLSDDQKLNMTTVNNILQQENSVIQSLSTADNTTTEQDIERGDPSFNLDPAQEHLEKLAFVTIPQIDTIYELARTQGLDIKSLNITGVWQPDSGTEFNSKISSGYDMFESGAMMKDSWLAMFAATSIYTPFVSKVGDKHYTDAIHSLIPDQAAYDKMLDLVSSTLQYSKPLYAIDSSVAKYGEDQTNKTYGLSRADYSGQVQRVTLGDLITAVQKGGHLYAGILPGQLVNNGDSWNFKNIVVSKTEVTNGSGEYKLEDAVTFSADHFSNSLGGAIAPVLEIESDLSSTFGEGTFMQSITNMFSKPAGTHAIWTDPSPGSLTAGIITNNYMSLTNRSTWELRSTDILFVNAIGDIHLADGTVILPAAANPVYQLNPTTDVNAVTTLAWYNPFTVAFMNSYPSIQGDVNSPTLVYPTDQARWHLIQRPPVSDGTALVTGDATGTSFSGGSGPGNPTAESMWNLTFVPLKQTSYYAYLGAVTEVNKTRTDPTTHEDPSVRSGFNIWPNFYMQGTLLSFGDIFQPLKRPVRLSNIEVVLEGRGFEPIRIKPIIMNSGDVQIFPYLYGDQASADVIARNMWEYVRNPGTPAGSPGGTGRIRESFLFTKVLSPVTQGTDAPNAYFRQSENIRKAEDNMGTVAEVSFSVMGIVIEFFGGMENFLGIPTSGDYSFLTIVYDVLVQFWYVIALLFLFVFIIILIRGNSLLQAVYGIIILCVGVWGFLFIIPRALPIVTLPVITPFVTDIATNAVIVRAEQTDEINNFNKEFSTTVLLSEFPMTRAKEVHKRNFITSRTDILPNVGIYLQGTQLRMSLDSWFSYNKINAKNMVELSDADEKGLSPIMGYEAEEEPKSIQIYLTDPHPNPTFVNYYTPLVVVQEGLLNTLNRFLMNFRVPQSIILDDQGRATSAYILPNYVHSYPFLAVLPSVQARLSLMSGGSTPNQQNDMLNIQNTLLRYFPNPGDILNLQWLADKDWWDLSPELQNTVWIQSMIHNGYYDDTLGAQRRQFLVNQTNDAAYSYLVGNGKHVGVVSDDTLIKMTALYATMIFNQQISTFGTQVYPHYFTVSDLTVKDILQSSILQGSDRFVFYDMNLIRNVYVTRGIFGLVSLLFTTISMCLIALINTIVFPIIYVGTILLLIVMMIMRRNIGSVLAGIVKFISLNIGVNIVSSLVFSVYRYMSTKYDIHVLAFLMTALAAGMVILTINIVKGVQINDSTTILSVERLIQKRGSRNK